ncbi:hypothetical protein GCK32_012606 [Trichostrongylus colubriformis]|uniref:Uncharacterized protein n=1 Tax=Trichostrongylus colubriformis TaxID=6319 RepID=A0AAN8FUJ1_TRICO
MHCSKVVLLLALLCLAFSEVANATKKDTKAVGSKKAASSKHHAKDTKAKSTKGAKAKHTKKKSCKNC